MTMPYVYWLVLVSTLFVVLERLVPWRADQRALRKGWIRDLGFLAFNGHFFSLWTATLNGALAVAAARALDDWGLRPHASPVSGWPFAAQFVVLLVVSDFLQWCVHNLLHRVPWLWQFHKVHHSVDTMDWIGNWRFHWVEVIVYRSLLWLPLAWLGAGSEAVMAAAVVGTFWGELNHANVDTGLGALGVVLNSPRMHLWHHDASAEGAPAKNFGVIFSAWDFLFGTAYWPRDRSPERIGYPGDGEMPRSLLGQISWPLAHVRRPATR